MAGTSLQSGAHHSSDGDYFGSWNREADEQEGASELSD